MRVLVATDAWRPQVNGVVRTYEWLIAEIEALGGEVHVISPADFATVPCPTYTDIRLALPRPRYLAWRIEQYAPDFVHIATEGPIGLMVRAYCLRRRLSFTTAFHTRFPEYVNARFRIPLGWSYTLERWFHNAGKGVMVASPSLGRELSARGFNNVLRWTRGVDAELFRPRPDRLFGDAQPVFMYVGRVAIEKNIEAFLRLDLPGRKVVVGAGPELDVLRGRFPDVVFTGSKTGEELARHYASADVFVFPSRTDTFGNVLLEAMASGVPVAAYPVTGPVDIVRPNVSGMLDEDLGTAARAALSLDRNRVSEAAKEFTWATAARMFLENLVGLRDGLSTAVSRISKVSGRRLARVRRPQQA